MRLSSIKKFFDGNVELHPFRTDKIVLISLWQIVLIFWLTIWAAAYVNGFFGDFLFALSGIIQLSPFYFSLIVYFIPLAIVAPIGEEWFKNYFYRRLTPYQGLILAFLFTFGEALTYWAGIFSKPWLVDWTQLIFRIVFPAHIMYFLVSYRFNFSKRGQLASTIMHSLNNGLFGLLTYPLLIYVPLKLGPWVNVSSDVYGLITIALASICLVRLKQLSGKKH